MDPKQFAGYSDWKGWAGREFATCDDSMAAYFRSELARCGIDEVAGLRILEIGFGNGEFAGWARRHGVHYTGTEINPALVRYGRSQGLDVHEGDGGLASIVALGAVDIVVAFDVFEHIPLGELRAMLGEVRGCLRPGGLVLARLPSGDSPFARAIQHGDLTHRTALGSSAVRQLAGESGFDVLQVREPAFSWRGNRAIAGFRRAVVQGARRLAFPIIAALFMGGGSPVLTPNMVILFRKP
jgi:SAM-dependent methyltransferase